MEKVIGRTITNKLINDGKLFKFVCPLPKDEVESQVHEIFEDEYYKPRKLKNAVCVDIGANIGFATLYLHNFCEKVYSIEPSPELYRALEYNVKDCEGVKTFNFAVFTYEGMTKMFGFDGGIPQVLHPDIHRQDQTKDIQAIDVPCNTLENFMKKEKIEHIDILKLDIEGSEYEMCMDKSFERIADKIDCIVGETHFIGESCYPEAFKYILKEYGFKFKFLKGKRYSNLWKDMSYLKDGVPEKTVRVPLWTNFIAWR